MIDRINVTILGLPDQSHFPIDLRHMLLHLSLSLSKICPSSTGVLKFKNFLKVLLACFVLPSLSLSE